MQEQFKAAQKEEPANLREHLPAINEVHYKGFLSDIAVFFNYFLHSC